MAELKRRIFLIFLMVMGASLHALEAMLPLPLPFTRLGLANVVTLVALAAFGSRAGLAVCCGRVFLGSLVTGTILGPGFVLSLGGGLAATVTMDLLLRSGLCSALGASVGGSFVHTLVQVTLLAALFAGPPVLRLLAPLALLSVPAGLITGWLGLSAIRALPSLLE